MSYPEGITKQMVDASAEEFVELIKPHMGTLKNLIQTAPAEVVHSADPRADKFKQMLELADQIGEVMAPHLVCKKGCGHCCKQAVIITKEEAQSISDHTGKALFTPPPMVNQMDYVHKYMGITCPFLVDNVCTVYEVRPIACRTHFNISKYSEICDVVNYPGVDTPSIDLRPFWMAAATVGGMEETYGDIREFFPDDMSWEGF